MNVRNLATAIGFGTLAVTLLDATDGVVFFGLTQRMNPIVVLQYIASGALGTAAFGDGLGGALVGLVLHILLALAFTTAFVIAYAASAGLRRRALAAGLLYGMLVWLFMNLIVLPHSGVPQSPLTALVIVHGLIGHALFVGLPAALAARRWIGGSA